MVCGTIAHVREQCSLRLRNETEIRPILPRLQILRPGCAAEGSQDRSALLFSIRCFHHGVEGLICRRLKGCPIGAVGQQKELRAFSTSDELIPPGWPPERVIGL